MKDFAGIVHSVGGSGLAPNKKYNVVRGGVVVASFVTDPTGAFPLVSLPPEPGSTRIELAEPEAEPPYTVTFR